MILILKYLFQTVNVTTNGTTTLRLIMCTRIGLENYYNNGIPFNRHAFRWQFLYVWPCAILLSRNYIVYIHLPGTTLNMTIQFYLWFFGTRYRYWSSTSIAMGYTDLPLVYTSSVFSDVRCVLETTSASLLHQYR